MRTTLTLLLATVATAACSDTTSPIRPDGAAASVGAAAAVGGVFTQTNDPTANAVVAFARHADGSLSVLGSYPTGGRGIRQRYERGQSCSGPSRLVAHSAQVPDPWPQVPRP